MRAEKFTGKGIMTMPDCEQKKGLFIENDFRLEYDFDEDILWN